jgi:hypothetical protein
MKQLTLGIVLILLPAAALAEAVTFRLDSSLGANWQVSLTGDDGTTSASQTRGASLANGRLDGDLVGVISPFYDLAWYEYSISETDLSFVIGTSQIPVALDISGWLGWQTEQAIGLTKRTDLLTSAATDAHLVGVLSTPFGDLPFDVDVTFATGGRLYTWRSWPQPQAWQGSPEIMFIDSGTFVIDDCACEQPHQWFWIRMNPPFEVELGSTSGITWTLGLDLRFEETVFVPEPSRNLMLISGIALVACLAMRRHPLLPNHHQREKIDDTHAEDSLPDLRGNRRRTCFRP